MRGTSGRLCASLVALTLLAAAHPSFAQDSYGFDIPEQSLADALRVVAQRTSTNILFEPALVQGIKAPALRAEMTADEAVSALLGGTRLQAERTSAQTIVVRSGRKTSAAEPASAGERRISWAQADSVPSSSGGQASSQERTDAANTLEEIIVTGEKSNRSLKDTATSVTVLGDAALQRRGLASIEDVLNHLTNVTNGASGLVPTVRGVDGTGPASGGTAFFAGTRTRLNIQVDGRPLSYNEAAYGDATAYDVQQVEMLRGPQSTLQGRNSIAGTLAIKTKDPTFDFQSGVQLAGGSDNYRQGAGFISMPLVEDQLAMRLVADIQERDSFIKMQPWSGESDPGKLESHTFRGKLLYQPKNLQDFKASLTINHSENQAPQVEYARYPYGDHVSVSVPTLGTAEPVFRPQATATILATQWGFTPTATFDSTISFTDFSVTRSVLPHTGDARIDGSELIVEPRLRLKLLEQRLDWLSGVFYYNAEQNEMIDFVAENNYRDRTETYALFTEGTYAATDRLSITLGGRYERENRIRYSRRALFPVDLDETVDAFMPKLGVSYALSDAVTVGALATRGFNGGGAGLVFSFPVRQYVYSPEYVWNYEGYVRAALSERLSVSANVFYSDYKDMQVNFDTDASTAFAVLVINLEDVKTRGADLSINYVTDFGLNLSADVGVLDTQINTDTLLNGMDLARSPDLTASLGAAYRSSWGLELSIDAQYSAAYYSNAVNRADEKVDPFWIANAKVSYALNDKFKVFVAGTNLFDSGAETYLAAGLTPQPYANILRPRAVNAGVSMTF